MSNYLKQVKTSLKVQPPTQAKEPETLDHVSQAIKAAVMPEVREQVKECLRDLPQQIRDEVQATASQQLDMLARKHARTQAEQRPQQPAGASSLETRPTSHATDLKPSQPQASKPLPVITVQRDRANKITAAHVGNITFTIERDAAGRAVRMVPQEESQL